MPVNPKGLLDESTEESKLTVSFAGRSGYDKPRSQNLTKDSLSFPFHDPQVSVDPGFARLVMKPTSSEASRGLRACSARFPTIPTLSPSTSAFLSLDFFRRLFPMTAEGHPGDGRVEAAGLDGSRRSFHSNLLLRSGESVSNHRKRGILSKLADQWDWVSQLIGQGVIFAGGVAIGVGSMMHRPGEEVSLVSRLLISAGIGCVLFAIVARFLAVEAMKRRATSARG
jgi:hypothetical protein